MATAADHPRQIHEVKATVRLQLAASKIFCAHTGDRKESESINLNDTY